MRPTKCKVLKYHPKCTVPKCDPKCTKMTGDILIKTLSQLRQNGNEAAESTRNLPCCSAQIQRHGLHGHAPSRGVQKTNTQKTKT